MAVQAAGLGDELDDRAVARGERAVDGDAGVGAAGEGDAVDARIADQRGADRLAAAGQEMQHVGGHARGDADAARRGRR